MNELKELGLNDEELVYLKNTYNKAIISNVLYEIENVKLLYEYFNNIGLNAKNILLDRLDLFLIDIDVIKGKISKYVDINIYDILKDDISFIDGLI